MPSAEYEGLSMTHGFREQQTQDLIPHFSFCIMDVRPQLFCTPNTDVKMQPSETSLMPGLVFYKSVSCSAT